MDAFSAESASWRVRELAQEIASDALSLALAVNRDVSKPELARRLRTIRKLVAGVEKAADQFEVALGDRQPVDPREVAASV